MTYIAKLINKGGRQGQTKTADGKVEFIITKPKLNKQEAGTFNPEQLLAAAAVSCFNGAFLYHLEQAGKKTEGIEMQVEVSLKTDPRDQENMLSMKLTPTAPHLSKEEIEMFAKLADKTCPYTKLFRGEGDYQIVIA